MIKYFVLYIYKIHKKPGYAWRKCHFSPWKEKTSFRCTTENELFVLKINKTATFQNDRLEFIKKNLRFFSKKLREVSHPYF